MFLCFIIFILLISICNFCYRFYQERLKKEDEEFNKQILQIVEDIKKNSTDCLIKEFIIVSKPGAAITVTDIVLTDKGKELLGLSEKDNKYE